MPPGLFVFFVFSTAGAASAGFDAGFAGFDDAGFDDAGFVAFAFVAEALALGVVGGVAGGFAGVALAPESRAARMVSCSGRRRSVMGIEIKFRIGDTWRY